jgi:hypothetical protein
LPPVPAVAPAPTSLPPSELAEEDPETPPNEDEVREGPPKAVVAQEEVKVDEQAKEGEQAEMVDGEETLSSPGTPTVNIVAPEEDEMDSLVKELSAKEPSTVKLEEPEVEEEDVKVEGEPDVVVVAPAILAEEKEDVEAEDEAKETKSDGKPGESMEDVGL